MVQLVCPLCGRFVSLQFFDPSLFEHDVLGVDTMGLGRGRGTRVVAKFSLLDDSELMATIIDRCLLLVRIIEGKRLPEKKDLVSLQGEVDSWKERTLHMQKMVNDLQAELADVDGDYHYWQKEARRLERLNGDYESRISNLESNLSHWQMEAERLKRLNNDKEAVIADDEGLIRSWVNHCNMLNSRVKDLSLENDRLAKKIKRIEEEEELAIEEMNEILEMINSSANTDFEYLIDAVEFLLEVG